MKGLNGKRFNTHNTPHEINFMVNNYLYKKLRYNNVSDILSLFTNKNALWVKLEVLSNTK